MKNILKCDNCKNEFEGEPFVIYIDNKIPLYSLCSKCKELYQILCHWCASMIFEASVYKLKYFWNRGLNGYPICDQCLGDFVPGDQTTYNEKRKKLGLGLEIIKNN